MATSTSIDLSVSYPDMKTKTLRLLSVLGKRTIGENGDSQFTRVQVGTAEEPLINDFVKKALHDVIAKITPCVSNYTEDGETVSFTVTNVRWDTTVTSGLAASFTYSVIDYCVSTAIADYLALYFPQQSQFYKERAAGILASIISVCYFKQPDAVSESYYGSTTGEATDEGQ